jgi:type II secretion system protein N
MKQMILNKKKYVGYTLYVIVLTLALLYYRFPSDIFLDYLQATVHRIDAGLHLSIKDVSPSFPFGLKCIESELRSREGSAEAIFKADSLFIRPEVWSFVQGKFRYHFECLAYDGGLRGNILFTKNNFRAPFTTAIEVKDIFIGNNALLQGAIGRYLEGILSGTITYKGQSWYLRDGEGEADLRLSSGRVELLQPILSLEAIEFDEILIKLALQNKKIDLNQIELKGREISGTLSGTINLKKDLLKSSLDLSGSIEPFADFFKSLTGTRDTMKLFQQRLKRGRILFTIRGTISNPRMRFT